MTENKPEQPSNDDIEQCRQDIRKASGGSAPKPNHSDDNNVESKPKPTKPTIPSFEEIISANKSNGGDDFDIDADLDDFDHEIDVREISHILSETGPPDIDNVFEDEPRFDLLEDPDDPASKAEVLADTDWQVLNSPSSNLDDVPMDDDDDKSLEMMVNIEDDEPLVSRQEQDMLMAELDTTDDAASIDDSLDDRIIIEQMQKSLESLSDSDDKPQPDNNAEAPNNVIPKFDVYENILSSERRQTSARRQGPNSKTDKPATQPTGTVGDIIRQTRADVTAADQTPQESGEPIENRKVVNHIALTSGIIHTFDNLNENQHEIIREIVSRDIALFCA